MTRTFNSSFDDIPANFLSLIPPEATLGPLINIEDSNPPTVLIGQLVTSANCGLVIQDKTCSVQCMVCIRVLGIYMCRERVGLSSSKLTPICIIFMCFFLNILLSSKT